MPSSAARPGCGGRCGRVLAVATELDLASNDYLGLSQHPDVIEGGVDALRTWGAGATGSRLVTGDTQLHEELESVLAEFVGAAAGLVFSSGYAANQGAVVGLSGPGSLLVSDAYSHASLVDACRLSRARVVVTPAPRPRRRRRGAGLAGRGAGRRDHRVGLFHRRRAGPGARTARGVPSAPGTAHRRRGARPGCARAAGAGCCTSWDWPAHPTW